MECMDPCIEQQSMGCPVRVDSGGDLAVDMTALRKTSMKKQSDHKVAE